MHAHVRRYRAEHFERRIELAQAWADLIMVDQMPIAGLAAFAGARLDMSAAI
jgi:hypothetical protein